MKKYFLSAQAMTEATVLRISKEFWAFELASRDRLEYH
jgi:hypothetical protein